ncbi:MAG: hypothetical protein N2490_00575 [Ignavibacteria bacterium]|nr:hypothetical protein [Ignavibacteria bacterium]
MNKINYLLIGVFIVLIFLSKAFSQGYTPPMFTLGVTAEGSFAMHDAYGTNFHDSLRTYGMMWGRGVGIHIKFGIGTRKNHRIVLMGTYNKFINSGSASKSFIEPNPKAGRRTNYNIWTVMLGYEYCFNSRCRNKQFLGCGVTGNLINAQPGAIDFDDAYRLGIYANAGYELVLDPKFKTGIFIGLKYNLANIIGHENGPRKMNDGTGSPGIGFWRRFGYISLNLGFNFYTGTKMIKKY